MEPAMGVIPALRDDLEVAERPDGKVDIRDPRLLNVFTLDQSYVDIAVHFDGTRDARAVVKAHRLADGKKAKVSLVEEVARELDALLLLDTEESADANPSIENTAPQALLESTQKRLRTLPVVPSQSKWSCRACGACCHGLAVEITEAEEARIDATLYQDVLKGRPFSLEAFVDPEEPAARILRQRQDENHACIFLDEEGLCLIHARQGMTAKPDACQIFPYMIVNVPGSAPHLAMRTNCRSMHESWSDGASATAAIPDVKRLMKTHDSLKIPKVIPVFGRDRNPDQVRRWFRKLSRPLEPHGATPEALETIDELLKGRVAEARSAFGDNILAYVAEESRGPAPVEEGGMKGYLKPIPRTKAALRAMRDGLPPPAVRDEVAGFLARQIDLVLHGYGPLNLPDAGLGTVALFLALEACMHTLGAKGKLDRANQCFMAFTAPILENTTHSWPILSAVDPAYTAHLREQYEIALFE